MATLTRRLQVLLDGQRFARLERLADERRSGRRSIVPTRDGISAEEAAERFLVPDRPRTLGGPTGRVVLEASMEVAQEFAHVLIR